MTTSPPETAIAIVAVSKAGAALACRLTAALPNAALYLERRAADSALPPGGAHLYDLPLRPVLQQLFADYRALVVLLPIGAAVRLLAPVLGSKSQDAAVVCVDDAGRYAISVLSGHTGGADALAQTVADAIGAQAVITSASDALQVTAVDLIGRNQGWRIAASPTDLTRAASAVVNGAPVALWLDPETNAPWPDDCPLSDNIIAVSDFAAAIAPPYVAALAVSDRILPVPPDAPPLIIYRPPTLAAGIGCRRGAPVGQLQELMTGTLRDYGLAPESLSSIATADIKADEPGIIALADTMGLPLHIFTATELDAAGRQSGEATPSAAQDLLGVFGVSEPAALLAAGANALLIPRTKSEQATVAVARIAQAWHNCEDANLEDAAMDAQNETLPGTALLAQAEREISQGNLHKGAGLAWQATMAALSACAARHEMPCNNRDDAVQFVMHLDRTAKHSASAKPPRIFGPNYSYNHAAFSVADGFREHYETPEDLAGTEFEWEADEFPIFLASVKKFIAALHYESQSDTDTAQ